MEQAAIPGSVTMLSENCVLHLTVGVLVAHLNLSNLSPLPQYKDWIQQQLVNGTSNGMFSSNFLAQLHCIKMCFII